MQKIEPHAQLAYRLRVGLDEFKSRKWLDGKIFGCNLDPAVADYFYKNYHGWFDTGYAGGEDGFIDFFFIPFPESGEKFYQYLKDNFDK